MHHTFSNSPCQLCQTNEWQPVAPTYDRCCYHDLQTVCVHGAGWQVESIPIILHRVSACTDAKRNCGARANLFFQTYDVIFSNIYEA